MLELHKDIRWCKKVLGKNCNSALFPSDNEEADFKFTNPKEALMFMAYFGGFVPVNDYLIKCGEINYQNVSLQPLKGFPSGLRISSVNDVANSTTLNWYFDTLSGWDPILPTLGKYKEFYPSLFKGEKYLKILNYPSRRGGQRYVHGKATIEIASEEIKQSGLNPIDFVFIEPTFFYGENFYEYLAGIHFREKGYFVGFHGPTSADLFAYKLPDYLQELNRRGYIKNGAFFMELELTVKNENNTQESSYELNEDYIIIEAESDPGRTRSGSKHGLGQAYSYLLDCREKKKLMTGAYSVGPLAKVIPGELEKFPGVGLLSFDENQVKRTYPPVTPITLPELCTTVKENIKDIIKSIYIRMLSPKRARELCERKLSESPDELHNISQTLLSLELNEILDFLEEFDLGYKD